MKRQPIVAILGHVDHGKTTLLDHIRGSSVAAREAGGITQHIGATEVPVDVIKEMCGTLLDKFKVSITIPGLLFIDTPGHHAFTSLRRRGGALADIAILVVDIKQPLMPQAVEAIKILRLFRVPFVVAANKIDTLPGWRSTKGPHLQNFTKQKPEAITKLDNAIYKLIGSLAEQNFDSERFDRVTDFTRQITIIPISAKTGEGIPELLAIITGLAQRYMEKQLTIAEESPGKGTILEVKEDPGLGITIDCILYDGKLRRGDTIAMLSKDGEVIQTRVRGLLRPKPLDEIRDPRNRFTPI
ncbi:MAG: translation initiation factor IF-2, partial [Methanobacteriota archaeon]